MEEIVSAVFFLPITIVPQENCLIDNLMNFKARKCSVLSIFSFHGLSSYFSQKWYILIQKKFQQKKKKCHLHACTQLFPHYFQIIQTFTGKGGSHQFIWHHIQIMYIKICEYLLTYYSFENSRNYTITCKFHLAHA